MVRNKIILQKFFYIYDKLTIPYALEIYAESIEDAKERYRKEYVYPFGKKRLPNGFQIWKAGREHIIEDEKLWKILRY